jgi:transcription initiation factor TFIID subunit 5
MTNVVAYRGHQNPVWDVDWSHMGIYFTTASRDRTARLWSTDRTSTLRIYAGHSSDVDVSTRKCPRPSETHLKQCVRFHPNSLYIATGSSDWTARLWDVQRGTSVRVFIGHQGIVSTLAFSPDGRYLATTGKPIPTRLERLLNGSPLGEDLSINLWDLGSGRRIKKMTGHTASVYSLAFSAESSVLVSGGADWTVRCWDVRGSGGPPETSRTNGIGGSHGSHPHHSKDPGPEVIETWVDHNFHIASVSCGITGRTSSQHSPPNEPLLRPSISRLVIYASLQGPTSPQHHADERARCRIARASLAAL